MPAREPDSRVLRALASTGWAVTDETREAILAATPPHEVYLDRVSGEAKLRVTPSRDGVLELLLVNPLDPSLPEGYDGFGGELAAAHERICFDAVSGPDGIEVVADGQVLVIVQVEQDMGEREIDHQTAVIETIATETERLHRTLRDTVADWECSEGDT